MKQRRITNSPLMGPSVCALVIIASDPQEPPSIDPNIRTNHQYTVAAVTKAADIANVPVFVLSRSA